MQTRPGAGEARPAGRGDGRPADPLQGRLLDGRYRLGPRIARGGMASVHEALDVRLDRTVAVKIMHAGLSDSDSDRDFAERFVREARAAARLSHPNVVAVHDQGDDDGTVFLVMELVSGHTLRDTIAKESPMPAARALALIEPVLSALAAAHRAGLIHRDVKPENVLISDDGRVKVADFGLAKAVSADTQHTATQGVLIGTVSYLAPELVIDGRADERADVYAAGVLLYELLTGVKPHEGETPIAVAYKHVHHDVPPPSERQPDLPPYVDALVARATARDRTLRPADAAVFLHQVHRVSQALADGLRDDPELTQDLTPYVGHRTTDLDELSGHEWEPLDRREPTTALPLFAPPPPAPERTPPPPVLPQRIVRPAAPSEPPHPRQRTRRRRRGPLLLVLALVLALAVGGGAFWYGWARYTVAPTVLGQEQSAAVASLEDADLEVAYADAVYDPDLPAGSVVDADPPGGAQVLPGDTVTLTLSLGELLVPQVRGLDEDAAQDALLERQLEFGESVGRYSEKVAEGTVLASKPQAGTELEPGTTVDLVISRGRRPIEVGDWVGQPFERAEAALEDKGLVAKVSRRTYDDEVPEGNVVEQPLAVGPHYRGDVIEFVVSRGPELVEVPDVYLFGVEAAEDAMRGAGFDVAFEDAPGGFGLGYVSRSDPEFGSQAPRGSLVTLYVV
ncbi:Stk1 family PASTA domain-containing Ser/Thr kinase [Nocardioides sp.]|uniref:Stk1 family PASTA domain-containing Ser/Thr kinase n=1 Tax=Nocardioides sp. TaxID=35761 RepID=UPI0027285859|nr:Stk1 family PASTA domain-containing Ser/Thr kinase [Nocardioides sp.]MDO9454744.1 Stk1 family PASTA domain-containing Ser/Thr kinase [Nocardioides sp.]